MRFFVICGALGGLIALTAACSSSDNDVASGTGGASPGTTSDAGGGATGGGTNGGSDSGGNTSGSGTNGGSTAGGNAGATNGGSSGNGSSGAGGGGNSGGSNSSSGNGGDDCRTVQCFRAYECVPECGSEEVTNNGCCPCPEGTVDVLSCPELTISEGISGEVLWLEGNHMPGPGSSGGASTPVSREVRIYEPVSNSDAVAVTDRPDAYGVYSDINGTLVATTTSDSSGFYEIELDPGMYSVFVNDEGDWYCNSGSADGLCTVTVPAGEVVDYDVRIDYAAAY